MRWDSDGNIYYYNLFDIEYYIKMGEFLGLNPPPQANPSIIDKIINLWYNIYIKNKWEIW